MQPSSWSSKTRCALCLPALCCELLVLLTVSEKMAVLQLYCTLLAAHPVGKASLQLDSAPDWHLHDALPCPNGDLDLRLPTTPTCKPATDWGFLGVPQEPERARIILAKARGEDEARPPASSSRRVWMKSAIVERELGNPAEEGRLLTEGAFPVDATPLFLKYRVRYKTAPVSRQTGWAPCGN